MPHGLLDRDTIRELIQSTPPLIEGAPDIGVQLQTNGVDLTLREVSLYASAGAVAFSNADRILSSTVPLPFDAAGNIFLAQGPYLVTFNEVVRLPLDLAALGRTRSSLLRCGVALHTAVWDAGYSGRSQSLLMVHNPYGVTLQRNSRIMQLIFLRLERPASEGYAGAFLDENI